MAGLLPLALLVHRGATAGLTAEPIEFVTHRTGFAALLMLMLTLAVTPARRLAGWNALAPTRRTFGLCAFGYACLHFLAYLVDQGLFVGGFAFGYVWEDVAERLYVTAGFTAFLLLVPLALTSTRAAIRRMGKRWQKLHRLVYIAAALGVLHFVWL
ncbi:MAG TPA: protein-methionine-sulfoxide reductase heme-binding subunit MsrQ, partial [Longimicrobium sp.]|nr:protein-methionine-sulfoxide reductase heme-binding subunit MsrQ [Longimicrobium sp.]